MAVPFVDGIATSRTVVRAKTRGQVGGNGNNPPAGGIEPPPELARALERDFGSVAAWHAEVTAIAKAQSGGSGWTILTWSDRLGCLVNQWAADHTHGLPGGTPILALDMYEHAYHLDVITAVQDDRGVWTVGNGLSEMPDGNILLSFRDISTA